MLHYGAGYTRLHQSDGVFWAGDKVIQSGYDQLLLFRKLCFFPLFFFFFFPSFFLFHLSTSRAQLFEICTALMVGYSDFLDGDHMLAACFHDSSIGLVRCVHQ
jgi:hypothetical protein